MAGRARATFDKIQKERDRQEKQAAKRARRQGLKVEPPLTGDNPFATGDADAESDGASDAIGPDPTSSV
ncbi:MAG TPA: hypothetical protein VGA11_00395 [Acidimicrobiia bacterium]